MFKVALILSGCGYLDGSEVSEAVLTLLALDRAEAVVSCFAPDKDLSVMNHLTVEPVQEKRNVLLESARITRGKIHNLTEANVGNFSAIVLPGGFGAAKNLSSIATQGENAQVIPELKSLLIDFWQAKKPIGAICISPAVVTAALCRYTKPTVTIGEDKDNLISGLGGKHENCLAESYYCDRENNIFSSPAYMLDAPLHKIWTGIDSMITALVK